MNITLAIKKLTKRKKYKKITQIHGRRIPYAIGDLPLKVMKAGRKNFRASTFNIG